MFVFDINEGGIRNLTTCCEAKVAVAGDYTGMRSLPVDLDSCLLDPV